MPRPEDVYEYLGQCKAVMADAPDRLEAYTAFENFYDRKLWHQLTLRLLDYVQRPDVIQNGDELAQLYHHFITDFTERINQQSHALIALCVVRSIADVAVGLAFLQTVAAKVQHEAAAYALIEAEIAQYHLNSNNLDECKKTLAVVEQSLDAMPGVDPLIHSRFYLVSANYDKITANFNSYYKSALLYLACTPIETISLPEQQARAKDIGIAALLGHAIYNFGELLAHPVLKSLVGTPLQWLIDLLIAFNAGDIDTFQRLQPQIQAELDLTPHIGSLHDKLMLMTLIEMIFRRDAGERRVSFDDIALQMRLPRDRVEFVVMKAMSLKLIRGSIDEVDGVIQVSWVTPRVLDMNQIKSITTRLAAWNETVNKTILQIQTQTPDLFVQ